MEVWPSGSFWEHPSTLLTTSCPEMVLIIYRHIFLEDTWTNIKVTKKICTPKLEMVITHTCMDNKTPKFGVWFPKALRLWWALRSHTAILVFALLLFVQNVGIWTPFAPQCLSQIASRTTLRKMLSPSEATRHCCNNFLSSYGCIMLYSF